MNSWISRSLPPPRSTPISRPPTTPRHPPEASGDDAGASRPESAHEAHGGHGATTGGRLALLALAALGIVYGDIGTSPLYAIRETFHMQHLAATEVNVLGVLSIIFWSLVVIISIKYLMYVMTADNDGEGGILALTSLITHSTPSQRRWVLVLMGVFGCALLYGDGMITPAISVLAAVEGVEVAAPGLSGVVIPGAIVILIALFSIQRRGTERIGRVFGPVMLVWFSVLALLGIVQIAGNPGVFEALNPVHAVDFFTNNGMAGFLALGSMFLVVTGGEALYADMGHFGRRPIQVGWFALVLPALVLNYFGQGALLLEHPEEIEHPFYGMAPEWGILPLTALATLATVIASQALISGVFSITMQASQIGWLPRVRILHTSADARGQIYIPSFNWALLVSCVALVVAFGSSGDLAAAYGVAVTSTMLITTILFGVVARERFGWSTTKAVALCVAFGVVDAAFLGANLAKLPAGGWFPLVIGALVFAAMTTWRKGRAIVADRIDRNETMLVDLLARPDVAALPRVDGTGVYLFSTPGLAPPALIANIRHHRVLHRRVVITSIRTEDVPRIDVDERNEVTELAEGVWQVVLRYGFIEEPNVPLGLSEGEAAELALEPDDDTTFFLGAENLILTPRRSMAPWRERLFATMSRNATPAATWFGLDADRVMTVGANVEI